MMMMMKVISLPYIFQVLYILCFNRPRYQVSFYRTIGPLVNSSEHHLSGNTLIKRISFHKGVFVVPEYSNTILGINSHMKGTYTGEKF